jgi:hypothetical protein
MPAHRASRSTAILDVIDDWMPTPARLILTLVVLILGVAAASTTWPPLPTAGPSAPAATITITPDDPAAATPVPVQVLER